MKWLHLVLAVLVLGAADVVAQDVFLKIPADPPTKNPLEGNAEAITAGMGTYRVRCADCHGMDARGIRGPDITQVWAKGRTDAALFRTIRNGVPNTEMPAHPAPRTTDTDIWRILAYLKTMAPATAEGPSRGNASAGAGLFATNCVACHRVGTSGGHLGPDLTRIGVARARAALARQIRGTMPDVRAGYQSVTLAAPDGKEIHGVKKNEDQFSVQVMDTRERIQGYLRDDMKSVTDEKKSMMPVFGTDKLTDAQLDDLLAYLESLQGNDAAPSAANR
ncbi:MAG TPA: c-type cytochrome [Vicinamibacterales bacterium]|jgi:putative heme-binding domain-containing protein